MAAAPDVIDHLAVPQSVMLERVSPTTTFGSYGIAESAFRQLG